MDSASIFCFSETWIKPGGPLLSVPGYQVFYSPFISRSNVSNGDRFLPGSCLFVPEMVQPQHPPLCMDIEQSCGSLNVSCCFIQCKHFKMVVASIYGSPSTDFKQCIHDLHTLLPQLFACSQYVILAGDFNIDLLKSQAAYSDCLVDFQLIQLVQGPSRVSVLSFALIDHILCSSNFKMLNVLQAIGVSDRRVQIAEFDIFVDRGVLQFRSVRAFRRCCWDDVKSCLSNALWSVMELFDDINDMWEYFYGIIQSCMDSYIPLKTVRHKYSKQPTPWLTSDILHVIQAKFKAKRRAERTRDSVDIDYYKTIKNYLKSMIRSSKLNYLQSLLRQACHAPRFAATLWSQVNEFIGRTKHHQSPLRPDLSLDSVNNFFQAVAVSHEHNSAEFCDSFYRC